MVYILLMYFCTGFSQNVLAVQKWIHSGYIYLEEPVRVASPTRINLEEPVRVASPTKKKQVRLSFQSPFSFLFCAKTTKIIFTKIPLANVVKKHVRMPFQPPFSFLFCAKTKKNCADKKSACE